jgi:hypothetical protein
MGSLETEVARKLLDVLLDLFPLPSLARKALGVSVEYIFERTARSEKTISAIAAQVARPLARYPDHENPGSARQASYNVIEILSKSGLGPKQLVELNLDKDKVFSHLLAAGTDHLATASQLRQRIIREGLMDIASKLVDAAPELPGVPVAFMQTMLEARK